MRIVSIRQLPKHTKTQQYNHKYKQNESSDQVYHTHKVNKDYRVDCLTSIVVETEGRRSINNERLCVDCCRDVRK